MRCADVWRVFFLGYPDLGMLHVAYQAVLRGGTLRVISGVDTDGLRLAILWARRQLVITVEEMADLLRATACLEQHNASEGG
jgi:hypothetical protein